MFINPVLYTQFSQNRTPYLKNQWNITYKGGPKPEVLRNKYKILLSQDIWAEKLAVKMPETELEKSVLLEILTHRKALDRFTRLKNERTRINANLNYLELLLKKDPKNPQVEIIRQDLLKKGNLVSAMSTLDKNIELEAKKNKPALDYFRDIDKIQQEYEENHLIRNNELSKTFLQIRKNNLNAEGQYSTQELIDIVSGKTSLEAPQKLEKKAPAVLLSRKQVLANARKQYEQYLRESVNIYIIDKQALEAQEGMKFIFKLNDIYMKKYPGIDRQLNSIFKEVQKVYSYKTERLGSVDIYPVGEAWKEMGNGLAEMRGYIKRIEELKQELSQNNSPELQAELAKVEKDLTDTKRIWTDTLNLSMLHESKNRQIFEQHGVSDVYSYLTDANKEIQFYKKLDNIRKENNDQISEEIWNELLA